MTIEIDYAAWHNFFLICRERQQLSDVFHATVDAYTRAVREIRDAAHYDWQWEEVERCKTACENARLALDRHQSEHGCGRPVLVTG